MPALRQAWLIFRPASRSAWKSRRIAAIWSGLGRFRMGRSLALCQLYDSHYGWTRIWGAGHALVNLGVDPPPELFALQVSQDEDRLQGGDAGMADLHGQHPPPGWMVLELESRVKDTGCCFRDGILAVLRGDQGAARWVSKRLVFETR